MLVLKVRNVNEGYNQALWTMAVVGKEYDSRNGKAKRAPEPVTTVYSHPTERVLFDAKRDANPFFHLMESIWMIAGRDDVDFVSKFSSNMKQFSDDGVTLRGAYGYRWRHWFGGDQLQWVVDHLKAEPGSRRAVLSMWDAKKDIVAVNMGTKDTPCNTTIYFLKRDGRLDMTVSNRSNDIIWGCYGANAVHMSFLHEFVSINTGIPIGKYYQVSNDWHVYEQHYPLIESRESEWFDLYPFITQVPFDPSMAECDRFCNYAMYRTPSIMDHTKEFLPGVAMPMLWAWEDYKSKLYKSAMDNAMNITDDAWRYACVEWLKRRIK